MHHRAVLGLLATLGLLLAPFAHAAPPVPRPLQPTAEQRALLEQGGILADARRGELIVLEVAGVIDAPIDAVWEVVWDFGSASQWVPDMEETRVVERGDAWFTADAVTALPFPLRNRAYRIRVERARAPAHARASQWENVPGHGNINVLKGYWYLEPWGEDGQRTLARQVTHADFNLAIPDALIARGARRELPATMEALRRRVRASRR